MQQRRRLVGQGELGKQGFLPLLQAVVAGLQLGAGVTLNNRIDDLLDFALHALQLALGTAQAGPLFHSQPVHLLRELAAELLEEVLAQQLLLQRRQHARLDLLTRDRQRVRARAALARPEAAEPIAVVDDEARAAHAALRHAGEQILRADELPETLARFGGLPLLLHRRVARLHCCPLLIVHDAQRRHLADDPLGFWVWPRHALPGVRILQVAQLVPDQTADVQLIVQDAGAALRVAVDRARSPQRATRAAQSFAIQVLRDLLRRDAGDVVLEDAPDDVSFVGHDLALTGRNDAVLERADDAVAEAGAAAGLAELDASAQSSPRLVRQLLQEHRVHRPLQADVEERDVAFGERDDADAGEGEALEEASGVFLVAAEAVERFGQHDVHLAAQGLGHHGLEAGPHQRGAGNRVVRVFARDDPALLARELTADAELVLDGGFALVL